MTGKIELSVILPVYNVEKYLERCLDSIINQTYRVGEIICVDDGSTDSSYEILQKYAQKDERVVILHKKNGGLVSARKEGLKLANGRFIAYVDSDDWIESNMYEEMMNALKSNDADVVTSGTIRDYDGHCVIENEYIEQGIYENEKLYEDLLGKIIDTTVFFRSNISIHIFNKIFSRELLLKYQMLVDDAINVGEDAACCYPCLLNAKKIVVTGKNYYHYCLRSTSIMGVGARNDYYRFEVLFENLKNEFMKKEKLIPNINTQFECYRIYTLLLRHIEKVLYEREDLLFPFGTVLKNEKIVLYGAGRFGCELKKWFEKHNYNIVGWIDKSVKEGVMGLEKLETLDYNRIIIAVLLDEVVQEIIHQLVRMGISREKITIVDMKLIGKK